MKTGIVSTQTQNELIVVSETTLNSEVVQVVNARDLHEKLSVGKVFANWIKDRIERYGFTEGVDFAKIGKPQDNNKIDYILTLDTAKEIAMVENNEKGREIRRYFIEIEKKLRNKPLESQKPKITTADAIQHIMKLHKDTTEMMNASKTLMEMVKKQELEILELKANNNKHKALQTTITELAQAEMLISVEEAGIQLGMSRNKLFESMRYKKFLKKDNTPYKYYDGEYFTQKEVKYKKGKNRSGLYMQTFILSKGLELLKSTFP